MTGVVGPATAVMAATILAVMPYGVAFALTLVIEVPVVLILLSPRPRWPLAVAAAVGVNVLTHPLVWLAVNAAGDHYWEVLALTEVAAWLMESAGIAAVWPPTARRLVLPTMLVANAGSCLAGLLLARLL